MLDHGLPVMVTRDDYKPRQVLQLEPPADPLLIPADQDVSARFITGLPRRTPHNSAADLAVELVRRMEASRSVPRFGK
jgi:hypothetical protein